ncbi:unnamed protein product [Mesocestoides corti]|uniref:L-serine deaminase n=1 Tax=Mesocestoides corti TaxID=53468 RepID=A0A3P6HGR8_MESCO|nr:unnamed protein product [Mesocestoides corti]
MTNYFVVDIEVPSDDDPDVFDPACDPSKPIVVDYKLVLEARERIKDVVKPTRCERSRLSDELGMDIYFKREFEHPTYSFKERGACNVLLAFTPVSCLNPYFYIQEQRVKGAVSASSGNHASAMAYHAKRLGIPCTVCMPVSAPLPKIQNCRKHGANIVLKGKNISEARKVALKLANRRGMTYINGYDHPHILAGQGVIGLEILEQVPDVDAVVLTVGGGGLLSGVSCAIKHNRPQTKIYVSFFYQNNAMSAGKPVFTVCDHTLADGLFVPTVGYNSFATASPLVDKCVAVEESFICRAILKLIEAEKAVVEGAGATGLAAILAGQLPELKGKKVVCILCGGNIDPFVLARVIDRGLALEKRLIHFSVNCSDTVGGLAELTRLIAKSGVNVRDVNHERAWVKDDIYEVRLDVTCETQGEEHTNAFFRALDDTFPRLMWKQY